MGRYVRAGVSHVRFVAAISNLSAPTVAEIAAGVNLRPDLNAIEGFQYTNQAVDAEDFDSKLTPQVPGRDTVAASSLTFHEDDEDNPAMATLAKGTRGFIVLFPYGAPAAGADCEVWPVESSGVNRQWTAGNETAKYVATFSITDDPEQDAVVAA